MFTIVSTKLKNRFDNHWGPWLFLITAQRRSKCLFSLTCAVVSECDLSFCGGEGLQNIIFISLPFKKARGHYFNWVKRLQQLLVHNKPNIVLTQLFHLTTWLFQVDILLATGTRKTSVVGSADLKPTFESLSTVALLCRIQMQLLVKQLRRTNESWAVIRNRNKQQILTVIRTVIKTQFWYINHNSLLPCPQNYLFFLKEIK
jgi:hypothetical protein